MFEAILQRFVEASGVTVIVRGMLERAFNAEQVDALFEEYSCLQYTRELLFSDVVMMMMLVACGIRKSPSAAYKAMQEKLGVSRPAFYNKLQGIELPVIRALLRFSSDQMAPVIRQLGGDGSPLLAGYRVKIIDGNVLGATEHRLGCLQDEAAAPLPGKSMVVLDPQYRLAIDIIPCEDAYTQERALLSEIVPTVNCDDVWIADRNLCTRSFLMGMAHRQGCFVIRDHDNLPWHALGALEFVEQTPRGRVFEQPIEMEFEGKTVTLRRVVVQLEEPTRNGEDQVVILSNLPARIGAVKVASLYRERWSIETLFQTVTEVFHCEIKTLGYPKAALFSFTIALMSYNLFGVLAAALSRAHGHETIEETFSYYYAAEEVQAAYHGMTIALPDEAWHPLAQLGLAEFCQTLTEWASTVKLKFFTKATRTPKKQKQKRQFDPKRPHVSTARLLNTKAKAAGN